MGAFILPAALEAFLQPGIGCQLHTSSWRHSAPPSKPAAHLPFISPRRTQAKPNDDDDITLRDFPLYNNDVCTICSAHAPASTVPVKMLPVNTTHHDNP